MNAYKVMFFICHCR